MTQPASTATYDEDGVYGLREGDVVDSKGRRVTIAGNLGIVQLLNERAELRQQVRVAHKRLLALLPNASETETLASLVHRIVELSSIPSARVLLTDEQIMNAAITAADDLDATRVSEMVPGGWKATTIFEGDTGLLRFGRLLEKAINGK